jgi:hypothetical protein
MIPVLDPGFSAEEIRAAKNRKEARKVERGTLRSGVVYLTGFSKGWGG